MFPKVRQIVTLEEEASILDAAVSDNDCIKYPTHVVERDGKIVGAASIQRVPLMMVWHHTKNITARDSFHLKLVYDSIMETKGFPRYIIACNEHSPYNSYMKKFGYNPIWKTELFEGGI